MDNETRSNNNTGLLIAIGLALGIGICILFMLNNISQNMKLIGAQSQTNDVGVSYVYDEKGRLTAIMPVRLKGM